MAYICSKGFIDGLVLGGAIFGGGGGGAYFQRGLLFEFYSMGSILHSIKASTHDMLRGCEMGTSPFMCTTLDAHCRDSMQAGAQELD